VSLFQNFIFIKFKCSSPIDPNQTNPMNFGRNEPNKDNQAEDYSSQISNWYEWTQYR